MRAEKTHRAHTIVMEAALGIPLVEWGTIFPSNTNKVGGRHLHHTGVFPLLYDMYSTEESA